MLQFHVGSLLIVRNAQDDFKYRRASDNNVHPHDLAMRAKFQCCNALECLISGIPDVGSQPPRCMAAFRPRSYFDDHRV